MKKTRYKEGRTKSVGRKKERRARMKERTLRKQE